MNNINDNNTNNNNNNSNLSNHNNNSNSFWERDLLRDILLKTLKEQKTSRRWKIFFRLLLLVIILLLLSRSCFETQKNTKHVALIELKDTISEENKTYENFKTAIDNAVQSNNTLAIFIKANSPGGSPVYSDLINRYISKIKQENKIPVYIIVEEVCASGCYYIAASADKIFAQPASIVGSIGVIFANFGFEKLIEKIGVENRLMTAGKDKAMNYPFSKSNPDQVAEQQKILNEIHTQFINAVKAGRGKKIDNQDESVLFSGRYWLGSQAIKLGLIDGFATIEELSMRDFKTNEIVDFTVSSSQLDKLVKSLGMNIGTSIGNTVLGSVGSDNKKDILPKITLQD